MHSNNTCKHKFTTKLTPQKAAENYITSGKNILTQVKKNYKNMYSVDANTVGIWLTVESGNLVETCPIAE